VSRLVDEIMTRPLRPHDPVDRLARMVLHHVRQQRNERRTARSRPPDPDEQVLARIGAMLREAHGPLSCLHMGTRLGLTSRLVIKVCRSRPDCFSEETDGRHIRFRLRDGGPAVHVV
jgi:hypothetical protein